MESRIFWSPVVWCNPGVHESHKSLASTITVV
jgi:hypothetical protein